MSGLVVLFPIFSIFLLADPNSMWYLFATSFVILSICCSSFGSLLIKATSSMAVSDMNLIRALVLQLRETQAWAAEAVAVAAAVVVAAAAVAVAASGPKP